MCLFYTYSLMDFFKLLILTCVFEIHHPELAKSNVTSM